MGWELGAVAVQFYIRVQFQLFRIWSVCGGAGNIGVVPTTISLGIIWATILHRKAATCKGLQF